MIAAHSLDPEQSKLHEQLIHFRQTRKLFIPGCSYWNADNYAVDSAPKSESAKVSEVFDQCTKIVPATSSLTSFNNEYLKKHANCARRTHSGLQARLLLDPSSKAKNENALIETIDVADMKEALEGLQILKDWKSDAAVKDVYVEKAGKKWTEALAFKKS